MMFGYASCTQRDVKSVVRVAPLASGDHTSLSSTQLVRYRTVKFDGVRPPVKESLKLGASAHAFFSFFVEDLRVPPSWVHDLFLSGDPLGLRANAGTRVFSGAATGSEHAAKIAEPNVSTAAVRMYRLRI